MDYGFSLLTRTMNDTLGGMLHQYQLLLTPKECLDNHISYNNSKWRILVRTSPDSTISFDSAKTLLSLLAVQVEPHLEKKHIHFEETSLLSMLQNDRKLISTVHVKEASMELYECTRSSPNFLKNCVDLDTEFHKTAWAEWKTVIGL